MAGQASGRKTWQNSFMRQCTLNTEVISPDWFRRAQVGRDRGVPIALPCYKIQDRGSYCSFPFARKRFKLAPVPYPALRCFDWVVDINLKYREKSVTEKMCIIWKHLLRRIAFEIDFYFCSDTATFELSNHFRPHK